MRVIRSPKNLHHHLPWSFVPIKVPPPAPLINLKKLLLLLLPSSTCFLHCCFCILPLPFESMSSLLYSAFLLPLNTFYPFYLFTTKPSYYFLQPAFHIAAPFPAFSISPIPLPLYSTFYCLVHRWSASLNPASCCPFDPLPLPAHSDSCIPFLLLSYSDLLFPLP